MKTTMKTVLEGYCLIKDLLMWRFDRHTSNKEHHDALDKDLLYHQYLEGTIQHYNPNACIKRLAELFPQELAGKRGKWTITVEFEEEAPTKRSEEEEEETSG